MADTSGISSRGLAAALSGAGPRLPQRAPVARPTARPVSAAGALTAALRNRPRAAPGGMSRKEEIFREFTNPGEDDSLGGQLNRMVTSMPAGIGSLIGAGVTTAAGVVRLPYDLARGEVRGVGTSGTGLGDIINDLTDEYAPLPGIMADSLEDTYTRNLRPIVNTVAAGDIGGLPEAGGRVVQNWEDASNEGRIVDAVFNDVGNVAVTGGVASRVLGSAGRTVNAVSSAERAALIGGRATTRSLGAAVDPAMTQAARNASLVPPRVPGALGRVVPMEVPVANVGTRGIAGALQNRGYTTAAARVGRVGEGVGRVARMGEAIDNATMAPIYMPLRAAGQVVKPAVHAATRGLVSRAVQSNNSAVSSIAQRFTPEGAETRRIASGAVEEATRAQVQGERAAVVPARIAREAGLTDSQGRAAQFGLTQQFSTAVDMFRAGIDPDTISRVLDDAYAGLDDTVRPRYEDIASFIDWVDGNLEPVQATAMTNVEEALRGLTEGRTELRQATKGLNPEQLGTELMTVPVGQIRARLEAGRARVQGSPSQQTAARAARIDDAQYAINQTIPDPPNPRALMDQGKRAGIAEARQQAFRQEFARVQRDLDVAVKEYMRAVDQTDPMVQRLARRIDTLVEQAGDLEAEILRGNRRVDATKALSRATGELAEVDERGRPISGRSGQTTIDQIHQRPVPTISRMNTVAGVKAAAKEIVENMKAELFGELDRLTGGSRLALPRVDDRLNPYGVDLKMDPAVQLSKQEIGGEYDWDTDGTRLTAQQRSAYKRDGILVEAGEGLAPDQLAEAISAALGQEITPQQAVDRYFDIVEQMDGLRMEGRRKDGQAVRGQGVPEQVVLEVAERTGYSVDAARAALNGTAAEFRATLIADATDALDDVQMAWQSMDEFDRVAAATEMDAMAERGENPFDLLAEQLEDTGQRELLAAIGSTVPGQAIVDWLRSGDIEPPPTFFKAVTERAGPVQQRMLAKLESSIRADRAALRTNYSAQRQTRGDLDLATNQQADRLDTAAGRVDIAEINRDKAQLDVEDAEVRPSLVGTDRVDPASLGWRRSKRTDPETGEVTTYPSRYEKDRRREGAAASVRSGAATRRLRLAQRAQRYNERISNLVPGERYVDGEVKWMPGELGRTFQERLRTDINGPAVRAMNNVVRKWQDGALGQVVTGPGSTIPSVTGAMGKLANKYGGNDLHDAVAARLLLERKAAADTLQPMVAYETMLDELGEQGVVLSTADQLALKNSAMHEQLAYEVGFIMDQATASKQLANAPFRVIEHLRSADWLAADAKNAIEKNWESYVSARNRHTQNTWNDYTRTMPSRYRKVAQNTMRIVGTMLDEAEAQYKAGNTELAASLIELAEDAPTTLKQMVDAGIDPVHTIGGDAIVPSKGTGGAGGPSLSKATLRGDKQAKTGLRALDLADYTRLEAQEIVGLIRNNAVAALRDHPGFTKRVDQVIADEIAEYRATHNGELPTERWLDETIRSVGWEKHAGEGATGAGTKIIPKVAADELRALKPGGRNALMEGIATGNRLFKMSVLPFSPKWLTGNVVGNALMTIFSGNVAPLDYISTIRQIKNQAGGWRALVEQQGLPAWAPDELASHGLSYGDHQLMRGSFGSDVDGNRFQRAIAKSYNINEFFDNLNRSVTFLDQRRKGSDVETATKHTLNALGDFTRMTSFERRFVREVLPFYPWLRHQTQAALRLPYTSPTRTAYLLALTNMALEDDLLPEIYEMLGSRIPLGGGQYFNAGGLNPFGNPMNLALDPTSGDLPRAVSPAIRLPGQLIAGVDIAKLGLGESATTRPVEDRPTDIFGREQAMSPLRRAMSDPIGALGEAAYIATGVAPQTRAARNIALGPGVARYGSGQRVGRGQYDDPNRDVIDEILAGFMIPVTENRSDDIDELTQRILREKLRAGN